MLSHVVHRGGINGAPAVDQGGPVGLDAACFRPFGEIVDQAGAPVDHGAEHIEHQRLHVRNIGHDHSRSYCHSGMGLLAQAHNPYSRWWLWIPGSRCARPGMTTTVEISQSRWN